MRICIYIWNVATESKVADTIGSTATAGSLEHQKMCVHSMKKREHIIIGLSKKVKAHDIFSVVSTLNGVLSCLRKHQKETRWEMDLKKRKR